MRVSWEEYALLLAETGAARSEDPFERVGACVLREDHSVAGIGYNGAPPGIKIDWTNRDRRRERVVHAEVNALRYVRPDEGFLLACTLMPCQDCIKMAATYGIKCVYFREFYSRDGSATELAKEFGIKLLHLPKESRFRSTA
jgi:dCMP deaminase